MKAITLNQTRVFEKEPTSKYWRIIECQPQTVELKTWANNHPLFVFSGTVINSHDKSEIGKTMEVYNQTYSFWLNDLIASGVYSVN